MAAETIIESFCERCGTRYTFEPVRKRESKLVGIGKSLGILLDTPGSASASRDPFHGTFHFCLECRQYTCPACWNEPAGFCLGCVPLPDAPDTAAFDAAEAAATTEAASFMDRALAEHAALSTADSWPHADLQRRHLEAIESGLAVPVTLPDAGPGPEPFGDDEAWSRAFGPPDTGDDPSDPDLSAEPDADLAAAQEAEPEAVTEPEVMAEPEAVAELAAGPDVIAEPEAVAEPQAAAELAAEQEAAAGPDVITEPEAVASDAGSPTDDLEADWAHLLSHQPVQADEEVALDDWSAMAPSLGPDIAPSATPAPAPARPVVPPPETPPPATAPAWQITAPVTEADARTTAWPPLGPVFRPVPAPPPAAPHPSVLAPRPAAQGLLARGGQPVAAASMPRGVRPCVSCELPLSASARFCRRCGRPQG